MEYTTALDLAMQRNFTWDDANNRQLKGWDNAGYVVGTLGITLPKTLEPLVVPRAAAIYTFSACHPLRIIGGWMHSNGVYHLDLCEWHQIKSVALDVARKYGQIAIFDLYENREEFVTQPLVA